MQNWKRSFIEAREARCNEISVKGLQDTLARMDDRIHSLVRVYARANQDIHDLKDSLSFAEDQERKTTESFDKYKEQTSLK